MVEVIQVGIYVEGKAVHGYPAAGPHAEGANLPCGAFVFMIDPDAGETLDPSGFYAVYLHCPDDDLFQRTHILMNVGEEVIKVENRIAYYLTRSVIGDVAAAVNMVICRLDSGQLVVFQQKVRFLSGLTKCINVGMFAE